MLLAAVLLSSLPGCYDDLTVTRYEPGEYKGAPDPLRLKQGTADQAQQLEERLRLVQMDR
jgi:hypothetical protein